MAGGERRLEVPMTMSWSKGSDTIHCVMPVSGAMPTAGQRWVRPAQITTMANSGSAVVSFGFQLADEDDEGQWASTTVLSSWISTETTTYDSTFQDLSTALAARRLIRFVLLTRNATGVTTVEVVHAGGYIEMRTD